MKENKTAFMAKAAVDTIPPNLLIAIRFSVAALVLGIIFYKRLRNLNKDYFIKGAVIGGLLFAAYCTQTLGITDTTPGKNAFLTAVYCVIVPFLFWAVGRKNRMLTTSLRLSSALPA